MKYDLSQTDAIVLDAIARRAERFLETDDAAAPHTGEADELARLLIDVCTRWMNSIGYVRLGRD